MSFIHSRIFLTALLLVTSQTLLADQPVMSEVPRWDGGYGAQVFYEHRWSDDFMQGRDTFPNPAHLEYEKNITHFEGVYTWEKWIRLTAKYPYVEQKRRVLNADGTAQWQRNSGFDDAKLALPLKKYTNKPRYSGNTGLVPQIRFGGDDDGAYPISDGSTDYGMSATFERETSGIKLSFDTTYWWEQDAKKGDEVSVDIELGWNFHDRGSISWEAEFIKEYDAYEWLGGGPGFFWNFNDVVLGRIEYKFAWDETVKGEKLARGDAIRVGLGVVF